MITQERIKELLDYDPDTGIFIRKTAPNNNVKIGDVSGTHDTNGYTQIRIDGIKYGAHRLAFLYMTGKWPKDEVDHINWIKDDNRWSNLRECTPSQNGMNKGLSVRNKSGYKGVYWNKGSKKWHVQIFVNSKLKHIGFFTCKHKAAKAYNHAAQVFFGEFAYINEVMI